MTPRLLVKASVAAATVFNAGCGSAKPACQSRPHIYVGAIKGALDIADPANIPSLVASANVGFYFTSYAMTVIPGLKADLARVKGNFASHYGMVEVGTGPAQMPDVASEFGRYVEGSHHWTWGAEKGATWPADIAAAGWSPDVALLNTFDMGATGDLSDPYYKMNLLALQDVRNASPGIRNVLPYITPNAHPLKAENHELDWSDTAWRESVALATAAGGLALDTPANYFTTGREEAYRKLVAQEIKWANQKGFVSVVLISPYALGAGGSNGADTKYLAAAQQEVAYLHGAGADPTIYVAANYAEAPAAVTPASETTPNSVSNVALWLLKNAATSPFPPSWREEPCTR
jgi:hypothetical protein